MAEAVGNLRTAGLRSLLVAAGHTEIDRHNHLPGFDSESMPDTAGVGAEEAATKVVVGTIAAVRSQVAVGHTENLDCADHAEEAGTIAVHSHWTAAAHTATDLVDPEDHHSRRASRIAAGRGLEMAEEGIGCSFVVHRTLLAHHADP